MATGWDEAYALIVRPRVGELLRHTAALVACTVAGSVLLGVAAAWLVERTDLPLRRLWAVLFAVPLAIPAFVTSYGWVSLYPSIEGLRGAALITTFAYYPFVYLPVAAVLRRLDPALEESARSLGHSPVRVLARVVLPQLRTAILGGALLVGLHLLAEYGALQMIRYSTFTTAIMEQYQSTFNGAAATMLAAVLVSLCLLLLTLDVLLRGRARYARLGSGAARPARRVRLGPATPVALLASAAVCGARHRRAVRQRRTLAGARRHRPVDGTGAAAGAAEHPHAGGLRRGDHGSGRAAGGLARGAPPGLGLRPCSSAAPTWPARCRAWWSRWPS